jgi:5-methylcytosine-specific restriction endonuclease McrA
MCGDCRTVCMGKHPPFDCPVCLRAGLGWREVRVEGGLIARVKRAKPNQLSKHRQRLRKKAEARCALCGGEIEFGQDPPAPLALTIDHIVPRSRGGTNGVYNLQPAHFICNQQKGDRA